MRILPALFLGLLGLAGGGDIVEVHQDFSADPGWEGYQNRVVGTGCPTVVQDFGWTAPGAIGGTLSSSTTPAFYGMKVGPFSFKDPLSASGRVSLKRAPGRSGAYIGFFNSTRQGWRPWSSMMFSLLGSKRGAALRNDPQDGGQVWVTALSAGWRCDGTPSEFFVPADGRPREWSLAYDPDATIDLKWPSPALEAAFTRGRAAEETLYENARRREPGLTRPELRRLLERAAEQGLVEYDPRRGTDFWERRENAAGYKGCVTFRLDGAPWKFYLAPGNRDEPVVLDRFGIVNMQTYGRAMEVHLSDLTVNGRRLDLSRDPGWEALGNRATYVETDFHPRHDFGFTPTNRAGKAAGEIGGTFWRTEPVDPLHATYADDVGSLGLEDPLSFSGSVCFTEGQPDAGMWIGYFRAAEKKAAMTDESSGNPVAHSMGIMIEGPTRIGYYFMPFCSPKRELARFRDGEIFVPDRRKRRFSFEYDPNANGGVGRITVTLDGKALTLDLTREQRAAGASFDRFGLSNIRAGGKFVTVYFDDLTYHARRPAGPPPAPRPQAVTPVPYPDGGRKH